MKMNGYSIPDLEIFPKTKSKKREELKETEEKPRTRHLKKWNFDNILPKVERKKNMMFSDFKGGMFWNQNQ